MKRKVMISTVLLVALFLTLAPIAFASTTWYVNGVNGKDSNPCNSHAFACKTIGHTISLAASGDTIMVDPATYIENLFINFSLNVIGSGAATTIIDGGRRQGVVYIGNPSAHVTLSRMTIRNGLAVFGGGVSNYGTLNINNSIVSGNAATPETKCPPICFGGDGGGIYNGGPLTINNSTVSGNIAVFGDRLAASSTLAC